MHRYAHIKQGLYQNLPRPASFFLTAAQTENGRTLFGNALKDFFSWYVGDVEKRKKKGKKEEEEGSQGCEKIKSFSSSPKNKPYVIIIIHSAHISFPFFNIIAQRTRYFGFSVCAQFDFIQLLVTLYKDSFTFPW